MNKKLRKYFLSIDDEPFVFLSFKTKEEVINFIYSLHEKWNVNNVEEETGTDFINFLYENIGSDEGLVYINEEYLDYYKQIVFDF